MAPDSDHHAPQSSDGGKLPSSLGTWLALLVIIMLVVNGVTYTTHLVDVPNPAADPATNIGEFRY